MPLMANEGLRPPNYDTPVGQVRLLVGDTDPVAIAGNPVEGTYLWYSDKEIEGLLAVLGRPGRVAIHVLRSVAYSTALKLRKWTSADLSVDGEAVTSALLAAAAAIESGMQRADSDAGLVALVSTGGGINRWTRAELATSAWPLIADRQAEDSAGEQIYDPRPVPRGII